MAPAGVAAPVSSLAANVMAVKGATMELLILIALGYVAWRVLGRKRSRSGGRSLQPPPPKGRPVDRPAFVYAVFSAEGREGWPPAVLKAVEGIYEVASADDPTTVGKMRTVAKRLTKLSTPIAEYLDVLMADMPEDGSRFDAFDEFRAEVDELLGLADEAEEAEDEIEVDVIGRAQGFVDAWQKTPNPNASS